jgi:hypothetical protein
MSQTMTPPALPQPRRIWPKPELQHAGLFLEPVYLADVPFEDDEQDDYDEL